MRIGLGAGLAVILALLGWWLWPQIDRPAEVGTGAGPAASAPQGGVEGVPSGEAGPEPQTAESETDAAAAPSPETAAAPGTPPGDTAPVRPGPAPTPPSFDVVRVEADGMATVAGRGEPGALVELMLDDRVLGSSTVDAAGAFAMIGMVPSAEQTQILSLRMSTGGSQVVMSTQTVGVSPFAPAPVQDQVASLPPSAVPTAPGGEAGLAPVIEGGPAADVPAAVTTGAGDDTAAAGQAAADRAGRPETGTAIVAAPAPATGDAPATAAAGVPAATTTTAVAEPTGAPALASPDRGAEPGQAETAPQRTEAAPDETTSAPAAAPQVVLADESGVTVLQSGGSGPQALTEIALDTISYDEAGDVTLAGRSTGPGFVQLYLDNAPVKTLPIDADGRWRAPLPQVDSGVYTLRIDEVDAKGQVVSRIETPFKREDPAVLAAAVAAQAGGERSVQVVTVQKGNTLWGISRERYGRGILYVHVFQANASQIRDPDLIYPGQVFTFPELTEDELTREY